MIKEAILKILDEKLKLDSSYNAVHDSLSYNIVGQDNAATEILNIFIDEQIGSETKLSPAFENIMSKPLPFTGELVNCLLVNAMRCLNDEQRVLLIDCLLERTNVEKSAYINKLLKKQKQICVDEWTETREHIIQYGPERDAILYAPSATDIKE